MLAFYTPEGIWYPAVLNGVYDTGEVYYSITFGGYSEVETAYAESIRAKAPSSFKAQPDGAGEKPHELPHAITSDNKHRKHSHKHKQSAASDLASPRICAVSAEVY